MKLSEIFSKNPDITLQEKILLDAFREAEQKSHQSCDNPLVMIYETD